MPALSMSSSSAGAARPARHARQVAGLDGLRAIAVILVLLYHLLPDILPGGMVGVDAFFVISGFLITSLLLTEYRRTSSIALRRFWIRRLRRIVPALLIAVVVVVSVALFLGGDALLGVRRQVLGSATLIYNWGEIAAGSSYFDLSQPLLLTNVWSLAVEEQFYVFWPCLIMLLLQRGTRRATLRWGAFLCLLLSFASALEAVMLALHGASLSRVYMGTDTHAFGLMLGAALALWHGHATDPVDLSAEDSAKATAEGPRTTTATTDAVHTTQASRAARVTSYARAILGWLGLAGLLACARYGEDGSRGGMWPATTTIWLILASVCAVGVVQALTPDMMGSARPSRWLAGLLQRRPLTWIGQRSYGLYLWHWPLWVLAFYGMPRTISPQVTAAVVLIVSVVAADLSYRIVETPIRRTGLRGWLRDAVPSTPRRALVTSCAATALILLVGLAFAAQPRYSTAQQAINRGAHALASAQANAGTPSDNDDAGTSSASDGGTADGAAASPTAPAATPTPTPTAQQVTGDQVTLVGDSVSLASAGALEDALPGIAINAEVSRSFYAALPVLQQMDAQYGARRYVVIGLATNGTVTTEQLDEILTYLGPDRRLILVTGYGPPRTTWIPPDNDLLAAYAAAHPGQVAIADWHAAIASRTDLLAEDLVHPGAEGGGLYAEAVRAALTSLSG